MAFSKLVALTPGEINFYIWIQVGAENCFWRHRVCMCADCVHSGTVVYCIDADKREVVVEINLIDSLPSSSLSPIHCSHDKLKGLLFTTFEPFSLRK